MTMDIFLLWFLLLAYIYDKDIWWLIWLLWIYQGVSNNLWLTTLSTYG